MEKFKRIMLWIISIFFICSALTYYSQMIISSMLLLIAGVGLLPPLNDKIKEKMEREGKIKNYRSVRNIATIIVFMIFFSNVPTNEKYNNTNTLFNKSDLVSSIESNNTIEQQIKATDRVTEEKDDKKQQSEEKNSDWQKIQDQSENETQEQTQTQTQTETKTQVINDTNGVYTGERVNGKKQGKGKFVWNDGAEYEGEFKEDQISGKGKLTIPKKGAYNGNFLKSKKNGQGEYKFSNGDVYVGNWENDKMSGQGKYTFKNGDTYVGEFSNNQFNGKGTYTKDGKKYTGTWKKNKYQK